MAQSVKNERTELICFAPSLFSPVERPARFLSVEKLAGGLPFYPSNYPSKSLRAGYFFIREGARPDHFLKVALK